MMHYMMNPLVNLLGRVLSEDGPANGVMFMESCMDSVLAIFREVSRRAKVNITRPIHSNFTHMLGGGNFCRPFF